MRHQRGNKKLGKPTDQRLALLRGLVRSLFIHKRIKTTDERAKQAQRMAERLITLAKKGDVHQRRQVLKDIIDKDVVKELFTTIAPQFENRSGGYTRITKVGYRRGDAAPESVLELVAEA